MKIVIFIQFCSEIMHRLYTLVELLLDDFALILVVAVCFFELGLLGLTQLFQITQNYAWLFGLRVDQTHK